MIKKILVGTILLVTPFAQGNELQQDDPFIISSQYGEVISGDIVQYIQDQGGVVENIFNAAPRAIDPDYKKYFKWDGWTMTFMNISGTCKVLVTRVTSGKGYDELWNHISPAWDVFEHPPYSDSSTWVRKEPIVAMDCNDDIPGINW